MSWAKANITITGTSMITIMAGTRTALMAEVAKITALKGPNPSRPPFWGGFRIRPVEIEFWADGAFRLHDRFRWRREGYLPETTANPQKATKLTKRLWVVTRLSP